MKIDFFEQKKGLKTINYFFRIGENLWQFCYEIFTYASEYDKFLGDVDKRLSIQMSYPKMMEGGKNLIGFFSGGINDVEGEVNLSLENHRTFNPIFENFNRLGLDEREKIYGRLRPGAKSLLEKGLRKYEEIKEGIKDY